MLHAVLSKDMRIVMNTGMGCNAVLPQSEAAMAQLHELINSAAQRGGSTELSDAIRDETYALMGCSMLLQQTYGILAARLGR